LRFRLAGQEADEWLRVELMNTPVSLANSLRRAILNEVPTMAVEEVLVIENSSAMTNEVLAHRISLVPFVSDIDRYKLQEACDCGSRLGCERCVVRYVLRAEAGESVVTVYSRDLEPENPSTTVVPVSGDIPLVTLAPGQRIELELYVRVGKGKRHAKWQSGIATLYNEEDKLFLYVESFGFLSPRRMLVEAVKSVRERFAQMAAKYAEAVADGQADA